MSAVPLYHTAFVVVEAFQTVPVPVSVHVPEPIFITRKDDPPACTIPAVTLYVFASNVPPLRLMLLSAATFKASVNSITDVDRPAKFSGKVNCTPLLVSV